MYINASRGQSPDHLIKLNKGNRFNNKKKWKIKSFFIFCIQFIFLVKFNKLPKFNTPEGQSQTISINQIKPKSSKNIEKTKKNKIADPNSPACTYMGLAILFFFVFFGFLEVFLVLTKSSKNIEKTKKNKKTIADPNSPACTYMGLAILFFLFFLVFSRFFLVFDQK